jgi:hypothetical protein
MSAGLRIAVISIGVMLIAAGAVLALGISQFVEGCIREEGIVARLNAGGSHPQIVFHTREGTTVEYPQGGMIAGFHVGQVVQVLYQARESDCTVSETESVDVCYFRHMWS